MLAFIPFVTWNLLFLGMISSILLLNVVQWAIYRERSYGLYTVYLLAWLVYYASRTDTVEPYITNGGRYWINAAVPMLAYLVYFDFADSLVRLRDRLPNLMRLFRVTQGVTLLYGLVISLLCFEVIPWDKGLYNLLHTTMRLLIIVLAAYGVWKIGRLNGVVPRYVALGSLLLLIGGLAAMLTSSLPIFTISGDTFLRAPLTYLMWGIMAELICFTLVLGYRQRRGAIRNALIEQKLAREREQYQRQQVEAELVTEKLQQKMATVQMMALQAQLNPHFLFNSLNTLSSLIAEDPAKAEQFVDEMANVYRYLLRNNDYELTTLQAELAFIDSYYHLLKTRYGVGIELLKTIDNQFLVCKIPPLTLQLLLENAVKHNVVSAEQPLRIHLSTNAEGWLTVSNTLQRRVGKNINSTQKGLLNILTKYQLLGQPSPVVSETETEFIVTLPLI